MVVNHHSRFGWRVGAQFISWDLCHPNTLVHLKTKHVCHPSKHICAIQTLLGWSEMTFIVLEVGVPHSFYWFAIQINGLSILYIYNYVGRRGVYLIGDKEKYRIGDIHSYSMLNVR